MLKIVIPFAVLAGALFAQLARPPLVTQNWWDSKIAVNSLNLTDAQTKQLTSIQNAYVSRLMDLRAAVNKAESNLADAFNQTSPDELKAEAAIDQYANARDNFTRTLTKMSLQMRNVLTAEQWQELQDRQAGRASARPGRGGGRRGTSPVTGSAPSGSAANKVTSASSQK
jgi:Spy/CpxP family protein refolding chaperone